MSGTSCEIVLFQDKAADANKRKHTIIQRAKMNVRKGKHVTELFYIKRRHRWQLGRNLKLSQNIKTYLVRDPFKEEGLRNNLGHYFFTCSYLGHLKTK